MSKNRRILLLILLAIGLIAVAVLCAIIGRAILSRRITPTPTPPARPVELGISVAPHLESRPDLLGAMGMTWVKVYQTDQIDDYPDQQVLYRIDVDPIDLDGWERGLDALARELDARGADAVEIGNEPNLAAAWHGQSIDTTRYVDALCRAYRRIKGSAPRLTVVSGGLAPAPTLPDGSAVGDLDFVQAMLDAGAGECFDAFAYHPYGFDQPPEADPGEHEMAFRRAERIHDLLAENGLGDTPVWITEFGWLRDPGEAGLDCSADPAFAGFGWMTVPRETQAEYTARAVEWAARHWGWAGPMFVWNLNWNLYEASYEPPCSHLRWYAILDADGSPLPVYEAIRRTGGQPTP